MDVVLIIPIVGTILILLIIALTWVVPSYLEHRVKMNDDPAYRDEYRR